MKKVYLGLLAFSLVGMLAACSGSSNKDYVVKEGSSVLSEQLMKANYKQNEPREKVSLQAVEFKLPEGYTQASASASYGGVGYLVLEKDGKYGVYSAQANKLILDARLVEAPAFYQNELFGFEFYYHETVGDKEMYYLADGAGNILYQAENEFVRESYNHKVNYDNSGNKTIFTIHRITNNELDNPQVAVYHKYDSHNKATVSDAYAYYDTEKASAGDLFTEETVIDLKEEGLDRKVKVFNADSNPLIRVYGPDGAVLATFDLPTGYQMIPIGKRLFVQRVYAPGINSGYTNMPLTGATNFSVSTAVIDFEKLERKDIDFPGVISDLKKLVNPENNQNEYYAVAFTEIRDDKTLGAQRVMIADKDFALHDDITRKNFVSWLRLTNGYFYDEENDILYDNEFNPVINADMNNAYFNDEIEYFFISEGTYYEAFNSEGKRTYPNSYVLSTNNPILNNVYSARNIENDEEGYYLDISTGKAFKLLNQTEAEETTTEEIRSTIFIQKKVEVTSPAKVSGSLRTVDGQELINIQEKLDSDINVNAVFTQPSYSYDKPSVVYGAYCTVDSENVSYLIYNSLVEAATIPVPNA